MNREEYYSDDKCFYHSVSTNCQPELEDVRDLELHWEDSFVFIRSGWVEQGIYSYRLAPWQREYLENKYQCELHAMAMNMFQ